MQRGAADGAAGFPVMNFKLKAPWKGLYRRQTGFTGASPSSCLRPFPNEKNPCAFGIFWKIRPENQRQRIWKSPWNQPVKIHALLKADSRSLNTSAPEITTQLILRNFLYHQKTPIWYKQVSLRIHLSIKIGLMVLIHPDSPGHRIKKGKSLGFGGSWWMLQVLVNVADHAPLTCLSSDQTLVIKNRDCITLFHILDVYFFKGW